MRIRTTVGLATAGTLGAVGVLHALWAAGSTWPAPDARALSRTVVGVESAQVPGPGATLGVVALLAATSLATAEQALAPEGGVLPVKLRRLGLTAAAGVLGLRGALGMVSPNMLGYSSAEPFPTLNRRYYSPLCLGLAVGIVTTLRGR